MPSRQCTLFVRFLRDDFTQTLANAGDIERCRHFFFCLLVCLFVCSHSCGHFFCEACALKHFKKTSRCFNCRKQTNGAYFVLLLWQRQLLARGSHPDLFVCVYRGNCDLLPMQACSMRRRNCVSESRRRKKKKTSSTTTLRTRRTRRRLEVVAAGPWFRER